MYTEDRINIAVALSAYTKVDRKSFVSFLKQIHSNKLAENCEECVIYFSYS